MVLRFRAPRFALLAAALVVPITAPAPSHAATPHGVEGGCEWSLHPYEFEEGWKWFVAVFHVRNTGDEPALTLGQTCVVTTADGVLEFGGQGAGPASVWYAVSPVREPVTAVCWHGNAYYVDNHRATATDCS